MWNLDEFFIAGIDKWCSCFAVILHYFTICKGSVIKIRRAFKFELYIPHKDTFVGGGRLYKDLDIGAYYIGKEKEKKTMVMFTTVEDIAPVTLKTCLK